jgi:hypothetical protein
MAFHFPRPVWALIIAGLLGQPLAWAQPAPAAAPATPSKAATPNYAPANALLLMNAQNGKAAGFTLTKTIDGNVKATLDPRRARYMDVNALAMVDEITAGAGGAGKRRAFYDGLDADLLEKMWQEALTKFADFGLKSAARFRCVAVRN